MSGPPPRPQPPTVLPKYIREGTDKQSPDRLRALADYATQLADWKEAKSQHEMEERASQDPDDTPGDYGESEWSEIVEDAREDVDLPAGKGTVTVKTIDGNDYYYLQWREGDKVLSKYLAPVSPSD